MQDPNSGNRQQKLVAGGVLLAVAAVIGVVAVIRQKDGGASCTLAASGVGLVADGLTKHQGASVIVAEVAGGYVLNEACKKAITTLVDEPSDSVKLGIKEPSGDVIDKKTTGFELAQPPPPPPPDTSVQRILDCFGWSSNVLYQLCLRGALDPPNP